MKKELVLFYLRRRVREVEELAKVGHEMLAQERVPFAQRAAFEERAELCQQEFQALSAAYDWIAREAPDPLPVEVATAA